MNLGVILAIITIVIGVIAIIVGAWAVRRWGNRRCQILFTNESSRLLPDLPFVEGGSLQVIFDGVTVKDPHLLRVHLQNVGPVDLRSADFDAGRPIEIKANCKLYGVVSVNSPRFIEVSEPGEDGTIRIVPLLLKRKESLEVAVIISGEAKIEAEFPLANVEIMDRRAFDAELARNLLLRALEVSAPVFFGAGALSIVFGEVAAGRNRE